MKDELKTTTIKEALSYPEGTPVQRMTGKLTHIFVRKEGAGDFGPYTSQSGVIEDDGDKMLFTVWNRPAIPEDYKGRLLIFRCGSGKKPTMTLKSDFKDATKRTLNVTKTCMVVTEEEDTDDIPMDYDDQKSTAQGELDRAKDKIQPKASTAPKKAIPEDGVDQVKHRVMQYSNLRSITDAAAMILYQSLHEGTKHTDLVSNVSSCFFIQACKEGLLDKMPNNKPIASKKPKDDSSQVTDDLHEEEQPF